jgi:hypothetical protein
MKMVPGSEEARTGRAHSSSMQQGGTAITARQGTVQIVNRGLAIIRPTLTKKGRDNTLRLLSASIVFLVIITGRYRCVGCIACFLVAHVRLIVRAAMAQCDYE